MTERKYRHDAYGRRVYARIAPTADGGIESWYSASGHLLHQRNHRRNRDIDYIYLGHTLIATRERLIGGSANTVHYQHTDALGTPLTVTDSNKAVIETSWYEPYGQLLNRPPADIPGYTGHVEDAATGLTYMQQRYYDPLLGLFLSTDPVSAYQNPITQFHRYRYANSNPYVFMDRDGMQSKAMSREAGRWIRALWNNDGDFEKAKEQIRMQHENDLKTADFITDFTALGLPKDIIQISIKIADNKDTDAQVAGTTVDEISGLIIEKTLDGKTGRDAASFVGTAAGKIVGDTVEFATEQLKDNNPTDRQTENISKQNKLHDENKR